MTAYGDRGTGAVGCNAFFDSSSIDQSPDSPDEVFVHETDAEVGRRVRNELSSKVVLASDVPFAASSLEEYLAAVPPRPHTATSCAHGSVELNSRLLQPNRRFALHNQLHS